MPAKLTTAQKAYRKWYKTHGQEFNRARAEKYASDKELREKIVKRQRVYRKTAVRPKADGHHYRKVGNKKVEVFRITKAAEMIGRDAQSIRIWEKAGKIPLPTIAGEHRYYTLNQIGLMKELADLTNIVRYDHEARAVAMAHKIEDIKARWAGV